MELIVILLGVLVAWEIIASAVRSGIKRALTQHDDLIREAVRNGVRDASGTTMGGKTWG